MYPKIRLTHKYRIFIFVSFVIAFFVLFPLIIFYTAGYRYDWKNNEIKKTGIISVDATPKTADVFLNDIKVRSSLPLRLDNRSPGIYNIKIKESGYKTWEKDIKVESTKTTYIKNIHLIKEKLPIKILGREIDFDQVQKLMFSPNGNYALMTEQEDKIYEIKLINLNQKTVNTLVRSELKTEPKLKWSQTEPFGLILTNKEEYNIQAFNANTKKIIINTTSATKIGLKDIKLKDNGIFPELFFKSRNKIYKISSNGEQEVVTVPTSTSAWYVNNTEDIYYYDPKNDNLAKKSSNLSWRIEENLQTITEINQNAIIATRGNKIFIYKLKRGKINQKNRISASSITKINNPKRWIAWSPWQFWELKPNGTTKLINRTGKNINTIQQLNNSNVLLLKTDEGLKTFNTHYYVKQDLFSTGQIKKVRVNKDRELIYIWGKIGTQTGLFELEY
ncbi:MAG: hypothetical protein BRC22_01195 [Parcubacteria group bacterium QH_9_35_7]|nr:MAG: hypothetical protein BRC22_01195 [Parcubacteria group bacterium QH_9_35_7]